MSTTAEGPQVLNRYAIRYDGDGQAHDKRDWRVVYNLDAGEAHSTALIIRHEGKEIWTADGGHYLLGDPSDTFLSFLAALEIPFDPDHPLDFDPDGEKVPVMGPDDDPTNPYWGVFHNESPPETTQ